MSEEGAGRKPQLLRLRARFTWHPLGVVVAGVYVASAVALAVIAVFTHAMSQVLIVVLLVDVVAWAVCQRWLGELVVGRNGIRWRSGTRTSYLPVDAIEYVTIAWHKRLGMRCAVPVAVRTDSAGRGNALTPLMVLPSRRALEGLSTQAFAVNRGLGRPTEHAMSFVATALADRHHVR